MQHTQKMCVNALAEEGSIKTHRYIQVYLYTCTGQDAS